MSVGKELAGADASVSDGGEPNSRTAAHRLGL
jgi:hypothetical protein